MHVHACACYLANCYWLTVLWFIFFILLIVFVFFACLFFFFAPPLRVWEARENVLVLIQKLSVLTLVVNGAVGLWSVGHQHQSAAARGAVEEALRTAIGQMVPQVRVRWESPVLSGFYLLTSDRGLYTAVLSIGRGDFCLSTASKTQRNLKNWRLSSSGISFFFNFDIHEWESFPSSGQKCWLFLENSHVFLPVWLFIWHHWYQILLFYCSESENYLIYFTAVVENICSDFSS